MNYHSCFRSKWPVVSWKDDDVLCDSTMLDEGTVSFWKNAECSRNSALDSKESTVAWRDIVCSSGLFLCLALDRVSVVVWEFSEPMEQMMRI